MHALYGEPDRVELVLYTDALITRGLVRTGQRRVTDILNAADDAYLVLEDVTVDEYGERGAPIRSDYAQINLDAVLFAVADTPVEPLPELRTPKQAERAILSVPPFRIIGEIHLLANQGGIRQALGELNARFLPVTDATFWSDRLGEARQQALMVAVNHRRAQILAPHAEVDLWKGLGGQPSHHAPPGTPQAPGTPLHDRGIG